MSTYVLELPGSGAVFMAATDIDAAVQARQYLQQRGERTKGLQLFRLPLYWVQRGGNMVWVPIFQFI